MASDGSAAASNCPASEYAASAGCATVAPSSNKSGSASPGPFGLAFHQPVILPAPGHELGMGSTFDDAAAVQYQNTIGADHAGQTMRENQRGPSLHQPVERMLDDGFIFRVDR